MSTKRIKFLACYSALVKAQTAMMLAATVLACIEEAITCTMTNLAPLFGAPVGSIGITNTTYFCSNGLVGSLSEGLYSGPQNFLAGYWFFIYGLMVYLPATCLPAQPQARPPRLRHWVCPIFPLDEPLTADPDHWFPWGLLLGWCAAMTCTKAAKIVLFSLLMLSPSFSQSVPGVGELKLEIRALSGRLQFKARNLARRPLTLTFPAGMPFVSLASGAPVVLANEVRLSLPARGAQTWESAVFACGPGDLKGEYESSCDPRFRPAFLLVRAAGERQQPAAVTRLALTSGWGRPEIPEELRSSVQDLLDRSSTYVVQGGTDTSGSSDRARSFGSPFEAGRWYSSGGREDWVERTFLGTHGVTQIDIGRAGTEVTTRGFVLVVKLRGQDGRWVTVDELRETNINRPAFSGSSSLPSYQKRLRHPLAATAIRLEFQGHGGFDLEDVQVMATPILPGETR